MLTVVTKDNLEEGIRQWKETTTWPSDFHNGLYSQLYQLRANGLGNQWWQAIVDILWRWKAIRPESKDFVRTRGSVRLAQLNHQYGLVISTNAGHDPDLTTVTWKQLCGLFDIAVSIKGAQSPVFGSKLCHFIFPSAFPVADRKAVGVKGRYKEYWYYCRDHWVECKERQELIGVLTRAINEQVTPGYRWATKITELCIIGHRASH